MDDPSPRSEPAQERPKGVRVERVIRSLLDRVRRLEQWVARQGEPSPGGAVAPPDDTPSAEATLAGLTLSLDVGPVDSPCPPDLPAAESAARRQPTLGEASGDEELARAELVDAETGDAEWERIILGDELSNDVSLIAERRRLLEDVRRRHTPSLAFAGELLLLWSATPERYPERLRPVGEAFYAWRAASATLESVDPLEPALARCLSRHAEELGLAHTIELVRLGDRFDSTRHHSPTSRGMSVIGVQGWVVLHRQQKVYTKASVALG